MAKLIASQDTTGDGHITIDDKGSKAISIGSLSSAGYHHYDLRGTYALSNLMQELTIANEMDRGEVVLETRNLYENPVERLQRQIKTVFWPRLTRKLDPTTIGLALKDTKTSADDNKPRIYVPPEAHEDLNYYLDIAKQWPDLDLLVEVLPSIITDDTYRDLLYKPGLLALDTECYLDVCTGKLERRAISFIVPGGRFNEFFGWDSYFIGLGLLASGGDMDLVKGILRNWVFEIQHYGLIPNANRTYYLMRSQPPFVTDLSRRLYDATKDHTGSKALLKLGIQAAIKEYHCVWVKAPRLDSATGLSKYHPAGVGIPLEVEPGHYDKVIKPFADKHSMSIYEFTRSYNQGNIDEPELEKYLEHDRGVMESGHDTSVRLEGKAANLAIIDLNCLLYKYERDIAVVIDSVFDGKLDIAAEFLVPAITGNDGLSRTWESRAEQRKAAIDKYLWDESQGIYLDYDVVAQEKITSESVTCLWALWSGVASAHQAKMLVSHALPKFEYAGGLVASSKPPAQNTSTNGYQWDYPLGWAPHQMLAWDGLARYGYHQEASRLAYRWLHTITKVYVDYGTIFEKYNVTRAGDAHKADAEYGNQGNAREGFGWTNASYVRGLSYLDRYMQRALAVCAPYEALAVDRVSG